MYGTAIRRMAAFAAATAMLTGMWSEPVEASEKLSLMCLGDSITDGFWLTGGYRNTLCALLTEHGQADAVDFVGPQWGGSGYDPQHAGYSGYSVDNIAQEDSISGGRTGISSFVDWLMETYPADVVFLQIGTNDILSLYDLDGFGARLEGLVDSILRTLPQDGALYLATLPCMDATDTTYINEYFFTVASMDAAVEQCNTQIRALAEKKRAAGAPVVLADVNGVLTKADLYDGVHPSAQGYEKMGQFWYQQLQQYWTGGTGTQTTTTTTTETTLPPMLRGDVNLDGTVTIADAVRLGKHLSCEAPLPAEAFAQADMDENQQVNAVDWSLLKRRLLER